jgi:phosphatidylinositol alpha-mannosyltransferase
VKIGLVCPYDYFFPGGVITHIACLAREFMSMGHEVKVMAPCSGKTPSYYGEQVIRMGVPFPIPNAGSYARVPLSPWIPDRVRRVLNREKFDVVHIHEPFGSPISWAAVNESRTLTVGTFHACHSKPRGYWLARPLLRHMLEKMDVKIAVSEAARDFVGKHLPADYVIIPNGVDTEQFSPEGPTVTRFMDGKLNVLFVGRLEKRKGLHHLLGAFGEIQDRFPDARLMVIGPGTKLRGKYNRMVSKIGLNRVAFVGFVPGSELSSYYRTADIFCSPATGGESFGMILLEAMACARPVVASNIQGYSAVVSHEEDGLLFESGSDTALADSLVELLGDPAKRQAMGVSGRVKAERFAWRNIAAQVMQEYISAGKRQLTAV